MDNHPRTVVAVMPGDFRFPHVSDAWIPATGDGGDGAFMASGRLAPGESMESAAAEYAVIGARDREAETGPRMGYRVMPFAQIAPNPAVAAGLWLAVAALVVLLLVSAANVANLLLARTAARGYEFAVRAALGASRTRLIGQIGLEALAMTSLAAVLGAAGAQWALRWFKRAVTDLPYWVDLSLRWDILAFVALAAALATVLVSLLPARQLATQSLGQAIRDHAGDFRFGRFSSVLIAVELAIAVAFLGAIGSVGRGLAGFGFGEATIPANRTLVAQVYFGDTPNSAALADARRLVERLRLNPGVAYAALGSHFPGNEMDERTFEIEGDPVVHRTRTVEIGAGYFETLGASLLSGRDFDQREHDANGSVAIVNARFAERYGLAAAVGRRIRFGDAGGSGDTRGPWLEIVGIAPNLALNPGNTFAGDGVYLPMPPTTILRLAILATGSPQAPVPVLHAEALALATRPRVQWSKTLALQMAEPVLLFRSLGMGLVVLGGIALLLSGASIYALLSLRVTRQRREIAVRMALGASNTAVVRSVLGRTLRHAALGSAAGLAIAILITRGVASVPYEIGTSDGGSIGMTAVVLGIIAAAACAIPLGRALRLRPVELLREN